MNNKSDKQNLVLLYLFIILISLFYILTIRHGHDWGDDFSMYIHHAKNIVEGINYGDTGYIYNKDASFIGPKTYPPIYPILLSPVYYFYGLNLYAFKVVNILFYTCFLFVLLLSFKDELSSKYSMFLIAIIGLNPYFWDFKDNVLSDIPFLFFTYVTLYLISHTYYSEKYSRKIINGIVIGVTIAISYGTRTVGFIMIPSIILYELLKFKRLTRLSVIITITFIIIAIIIRVFFHDDSSYLDQFGRKQNYIIRNIIDYIKALAYVWYSGNDMYSAILRRIILVVFSFLSLIGYIKKIKEELTIYEIYLIFYLAIIILWPSGQGTRFLIPIIPLYIYYAIIGITTIKYNKTIFVGIILLTSIIYINAYKNINYGPIKPIGTKECTKLFTFIKDYTNKTDIIIFRKPRVLSLYTDRKSSGYHRAKEDRELWIYFKQIGASYIIVANDLLNKNRYTEKFVDKYRGHLEKVYSSIKFRVYRIKTWP